MYQLYDANNATVEPVTVSELKSELRITHSDQDTMLAIKIAAARKRAEDITKRYLRVGSTSKSAIYRMYLDKFPDEGSREIKIYICPVNSISSIYYYNASGILTLLNTDYYNIDTISEPARIAESYNHTWPDVQKRINAIYVEFQAGYQLIENIPDLLRQGIFMLACHYYENPSSVMTGTQVNTIPESSQEIFNNFRVNRI